MYYTLRYMKLFILYAIRKEYHNSSIVVPMYKIVIRLAPLIMEECHYYQLHKKFDPPFFS
jgi:hypothetical protein